MRIARRSALALLGSSALAGLVRPARAGDKFVTVGINLSLTGAAAEDATNMLHGAQLAIEEANARGGIGGYEIRQLTLDDGTATAGQYDPAQAAINTRKMVVDPTVVAAVGPMASGSGKAMAPLLSQGNLATVTPSSTNPDLTDPKFAEMYRPAGKAIYFRTCTTDAFQGPNMANFMADQLKVKSVFVIDDTGAYGVGLADAFQAQAAKRGMQVMGRDRVDPLISDYRPLLTKIKQLAPQAMYCGSSALAGVKLVKQSYETHARHDQGGRRRAAPGVDPGRRRFSLRAGLVQHHRRAAHAGRCQAVRVGGEVPEALEYAAGGLLDHSYDAALVILAAIETVAKSGAPVTRGAVRDAIQAGKVDTLQGPIAYDANGDISSRVVSVFQVQQDTAHPVNDVVHQFKYIGVALASSA